MVNVGSRKLAAKLKSRETSQAEAARVLEVSRPYVNQILKGRRQPSIDVLARIEKNYGIPPRDFAEVA